MKDVKQPTENRQLDLEQMDQIVGGIACDEVQDVLDWLWANNRSQYLEVMDTFLHGPYELQCT